jgi:hypothetical protein
VINVTNIFSRIKGQLNQDFGGRYLGVLLEQVIFDAPKFAKVLFPVIPREVLKSLKNGTATAIAEFEFLGKGGKRRRADLAIVSDKRIIALVEIKYEDHKAPKNFAQIKDYLFNANGAGKPYFTYLTQHAPPKTDMLLIETARKKSNRIRHLYFRDLHREGRSFTDPVVRWLCDFLGEEHLVFRGEFKDNALIALKLLLTRGFHVKHAHGLGRKLSSFSNTMTAVELFSGFLGNAMALADWFHELSRDHFGNRFVPKFAFDPEFKMKSLKQTVAKNQAEETIFLERKAREGGEFWIQATGTVKGGAGGNWLYVSIGYWFTVSLTTKKVQSGIYAEIEGRGIVDNHENLRSFPLNNRLKLTERKAQRIVLRSINAAIKLALSDTALPQHARNRLDKLADHVKKLKPTA